MTDMTDLSILILRGRFLKRSRTSGSYTCIRFQSSFYEDASWNERSTGASHLELTPFNPHFTRTLLETGIEISAVGTPTTFNPHFTRTLLETPSRKPSRKPTLFFQSSFYEDASWNWASRRWWPARYALSILILRGRFLKPGLVELAQRLRNSFNPHFTRTLLETTNRTREGAHGLPFNPHFTRTLLETVLQGCVSAGHH